MVHKAIRTARPGKERQAERHTLYQTIDGQVWEGGVDAVLLQLRAVRPPVSQEPISALEEAIAYRDHQRAWIGNYA